MKNALTNAISLLGRVEGLGVGVREEGGREVSKVEEQQWSALRRAHALTVEQRSVLRRGALTPD